MWALLFLTLAGSAALAAFGPAATDEEGATGAAIVLLAVFVPMGLVPPVAAWLGRDREPGPRPGAAVLAPQPVWAVRGPDRGRADPLERLEKLAELRASGALTEAEFEEQKRRLLEEI